MSKFICHTKHSYLHVIFQKGKKRKNTDSTCEQPRTKNIWIKIKGVTRFPNIRGVVTAAVAPYGKPKDIIIRKSKVAENKFNVRFLLPNEEIADKIISASDSIQVLFIFLS